MANNMVLWTPYGNRYVINLDTGAINGSDTWLFLGFQHVKRGEFIARSKLTPALMAGMVWMWKNGYPQWTVRDLGHGWAREWGNTHYHGVAGAYLEAGGGA
jgi:hypothetical protein